MACEERNVSTERASGVWERATEHPEALRRHWEFARCALQWEWFFAVVIHDRATARKVIDHLGIAAHPKPSPRARGPAPRSARGRPLGDNEVGMRDPAEKNGAGCGEGAL